MPEPFNYPDVPKLRPLDARWVEDQGQSYLMLRDSLGLTQQSVLVPAGLAPLLALFDGARDVQAIRANLALRSAVDVPELFIRRLVAQLDEALLLESDRFRSAFAERLQAYREAPFRPPVLAESVYPADPHALRAAFDRFCREAPGDEARRNGAVVGLLSPHIDYQRGWRVYARTWRHAAAAGPFDLAVVFGTDHAGLGSPLTLTRQSYATPWGVLPTPVELVDGLADALGPDHAFADEAHHWSEHSIELAAVWLHYALGQAGIPVLPLLCGSFHTFVLDGASPEDDPRLSKALSVLRQAIECKRVLVVAAGDLAHVGPVFGDVHPLDGVARAELAAADQRLLAIVCAADAAAFFSELRAEQDRRRVCGLSPTYLMLRLLEGAQGSAVDYEQCPADVEGGSLVSIAGVVFRRSEEDPASRSF
ncbi:MAG: AmmeMemoRadiSam system protein B [Chloroflexi bacterium]|nr:AmmeMemoRadiSam system protein B [Chloroflexota bacterium]